MKSTKFIVLCLLFATLFLSAGCGKEEKEPPAVRLVSKIEHYENNGNVVTLNQTIEYRYDEQNRITEMIYTDKTGVSGSGIFSYPVENTMVAGNATYTLNSDGSIASWSADDRLMETCTYANGFLERREQYSEFGTIPVTTFETYTWENGNIKTIVLEVSFLTDPPESYSTTLFFEYSIQNKPSSIEFHRFHVGFPRGWNGKSALNLPSKITNKGDTFEEVTTYRYETDRKGYPIRIFVQENDGDEELRTVIEYED